MLSVMIMLVSTIVVTLVISWLTIGASRRLRQMFHVRRPAGTYLTPSDRYSDRYVADDEGRAGFGAEPLGTPA